MKKLEKDLIFFHSGKRGPVFTYKAGHFVDVKMIQDTVDHLVYETDEKVKWVEERRSEDREERRSEDRMD